MFPRFVDFIMRQEELPNVAPLFTPPQRGRPSPHPRSAKGLFAGCTQTPRPTQFSQDSARRVSKSCTSGGLQTKMPRNLTIRLCGVCCYPAFSHHGLPSQVAVSCGEFKKHKHRQLTLLSFLGQAVIAVNPRSAAPPPHRPSTAPPPVLCLWLRYPPSHPSRSRPVASRRGRCGRRGGGGCRCPNRPWGN